MEIHFLAEIATTLASVHEFPGELESESDIVRATAPFPIPNSGHAASLVVGLGRSGLVAVVAGAGLDGALAAGPGNGVGHRRTGDGVNEAGFTATCKKL